METPGVTILDLPDELIIYIFSMLPTFGLLKGAAKVCHRFNDLAHNPAANLHVTIAATEADAIPQLSKFLHEATRFSFILFTCFARLSISVTCKFLFFRWIHTRIFNLHL